MATANNRKLVNDLRASLDAAAAQAALDQGAITPIQARNIMRWIDQVREIQANPLYAIKDEQGQYIGSVAASAGGTKWTGRRFGADYEGSAATFDSCDEAAQYVQGKAGTNG